MCSFAPRGARSRGVVSCGSRTRSQAGARNLALRGPGCAPGLPSALGQAHDSEHRPNRRSVGLRRLSAEKNRARGPLRLFIISNHRAGRPSRHPSINPSGWCPTAPARRCMLFDMISDRWWAARLSSGRPRSYAATAEMRGIPFPGRSPRCRGPVPAFPCAQEFLNLFFRQLFTLTGVPRASLRSIAGLAWEELR